jgi:hypothetical protein
MRRSRSSLCSPCPKCVHSELVALCLWWVQRSARSSDDQPEAGCSGEAKVCTLCLHKHAHVRSVEMVRILSLKLPQATLFGVAQFSSAIGAFLISERAQQGARSRKYSSTLSDNTARLSPCSEPIKRALQNDLFTNQKTESSHVLRVSLAPDSRHAQELSFHLRELLANKRVNLLP